MGRACDAAGIPEPALCMVPGLLWRGRVFGWITSWMTVGTLDWWTGMVSRDKRLALFSSFIVPAKM